MAERNRIPKTTRKRVANNSQLFRTTTNRTSQDGNGYKYRNISHRNMKTEDIVLIQDSNLIRGQWKLGEVSNTYPGMDGKVRKVDVQYKNLNEMNLLRNIRAKAMLLYRDLFND